ncbi:IclR family transcriptional regulator [Dietzia sp. ANT_WB102]|uniref:IclR family transcriptional regulator n=1 Tax=Dietzia sp. ANT_WB102 TaxID=2597345 RepID=UPI0011EBFC2C|nr:IclR family transcriptional regulator [Dietzia sp. ANT_WB102]KAA0918344.1 IclR family transcriptional regulator [Dietzia sp. ANT_WB102]
MHITVKTVRSLHRGLQALEAIAEHQPIGLTALCSATGDDKSALQRTLATLHEAGWIQRAATATPQWELATKPIVMLSRARQSSSVQARARELLGPLRDATGETVHLALLDGTTIVVADVAESTQVVRTALPIGQIHPPERSAAGRAIMSYLTPEERAAWSSAPENLLPAAEFEEIRARGWAASAGAVLEGSNSVGAAILDPSGSPVGALVISSPATRLPTEKCGEFGDVLVDAIRRLSPHG